MRLLILSCSQRKHPDDALLPAIERYDGPLYRVLRRFLKHETDAALDIWILSARFGLIAHDASIPTYDQKMTVQQATALRPTVNAQLVNLLHARPYDAVCFAMGQTYCKALGEYAHALPPQSTYTLINGTIGRMLADLHTWLYPTSSTDQWRGQVSTKQSTSPQLRGIAISLTPEQVLDRARQALAHRRGDPARYASWYVDVDGQRVALKWLVSQVVDLPVGSFSTSEARRLLGQLGIKAQRQ
jgi:hypothetical protein